MNETAQQNFFGIVYDTARSCRRVKQFVLEPEPQLTTSKCGITPESRMIDSARDDAGENCLSYAFGRA